MHLADSAAWLSGQTRAARAVACGLPVGPAGSGSGDTAGVLLAVAVTAIAGVVAATWWSTARRRHAKRITADDPPTQAPGP